MRWTVAVIALVPATAFAGKGIAPVVTVQDADGAPITTAVVVHDTDGERHKVHGQTGSWTSQGLYTPDGEYVAFAKGSTLTFMAGAPGYVPARSTSEIDSKKFAVSVTLERLPAMSFDCAGDVDVMRDEAVKWADEQLAAEEVTDAECVYGVRAVAEHARWVRAADRLVAEPSSQTAQAEAEARTAAHEAAWAWLQRTDGAVADADAALLCQATARDLAACQAPEE